MDLNSAPSQSKPVPPHPTLTKPVLHVRDGVSGAVDDAQIVQALSECLRVRPRLQQESGSRWESARGTIEFEDVHRAEKALATVNGYRFQGENEPLRLFINASGTDPIPSAKPRIFKLLPENVSTASLFDVCRFFGPIQNIASVPAHTPDGSQSMIVTFYAEEHAVTAARELHLAEIAGNTVTVETYSPVAHALPIAGRGALVSRGEMDSIPSASRLSTWRSNTTNATSPSYGDLNQEVSSPNQMGNRISSLTAHRNAPPFNPSPQRAFSGSALSTRGVSDLLSPTRTIDIGNTSTVDPCNLFVKNLDQATTTAKLHALFSEFGAIVSARVMEDPISKTSKEFGFVSYKRPEEAAAALAAMNGFRLPDSNKHIVVRLHEPRNLREGRMRRASNSNLGVNELVPDGRGLARSPSSASSTYSADECWPSPSPSPSRSPSPSPSRSTDPALTSAKSSPETIPSPPATMISSPSSQISDRERLFAAVSALVASSKVADVVNLLEGLPKKQQKLCLFNTAILKTKVADALEILSVSDDDDNEPLTTTTLQPATPSSKPSKAQTSSSPVTAAVVDAPQPPPKSVPDSLTTLAKLPVVKILPLLPFCGSLGIEVVPEATRMEIDAFVDAIEGKPVHEAKQKLGERVFKAIKATGLKGAPRFTIHLLDTEDLRSLAHLLAYPTVLKEKVLLLAKNTI